MKVLQTQFNKGELGAELAARVDLDFYAGGCKTMLNILPTAQGGAKRFWGTRLDAVLSARSRIIGMEFSSTARFIFAFSDAALTIYEEDGTIRQTLVGPWADAEIMQMDIAQALDTVIVCHDDFPPQRIWRDRSNVFGIEDLTDSSNVSGVYFTTIPTSEALTRWAASTTYPKGWLIRSTVDSANANYWKATKTGVSGAAEVAWASYPNAGQQVGDGTQIWENMGPLTAIEVWSATKGWPRAVTFFEGRTIFAGSKSYPTRVWGSKTGEYFNFDTTGVLAGDGLDLELTSDSLNQIQWVLAGRKLLIGTDRGEWAALTSPLTPTSAGFEWQTGIGSARLRPVSVDGAVIHLTRGANQLRELVFDEAEAAHVTASLSVRNPTVISGAVSMASKSAADEDDANVVVIVNQDGNLAVMFSLREQGLLAWCRRTFAGGSVECVATLSDRIYLSIRHGTGDGVYVDGVFDEGVYADEDQTYSRFLCHFDEEVFSDYVLRATNFPAGASFSGFTSLEGETVAGRVDGFMVEDVVVASGAVNVGFDAELCEMGIPLPTPTISPMAPFTEDGNLYKRRRVVRSNLRLKDTEQLVVDGVEVELRGADFDPSEPIDPVTDVVVVRHRGWSREPDLVITAPRPGPFHILALEREVQS
jgi:hypothetical protein